MDSKKKKNLEETYERIINVGLCVVPYEDLSDIVGPNPMAFGTTKDEKVFSFKDLDRLFKSQYEQMSNMEVEGDRERISTRISEDGNNAFIVEEVTLTLSSPEANNNIFARISCVMEYLDSRWKLTHWHASTPVDTENDHWHMEEWKREKEKLQKLVDQQTADLQQKNRELEIEAAIERVRAVAMGMTKPDDMLEVCRVISDQLQHFGVEHIRNVQTAIINQEKSTLHNYQYFAAYKKDAIEITEYHKNPVVNDMANRMLESADGFFTGSLAGQELEEFRAYRKQENQFPDPLLDETESVDYHFYSIGPGGLGLTLYQPLNEEGLDIFKRFHNVFSLAYRRFRDIEQAEAQAREAEIQLALERVRARTMAMQHSDELIETSELLFEQIKNLGIELWSCGFSLWYDDDSYFVGYNPGPDGKMGAPLRIPLTEDVFFTTIREAKRRGEEFLVFESEGESLEQTYRYMDTLPVVGETMRGIVEAGFPLPKYQVTHCGFFSHGHLMFITQEPNPEAIDIFKRFTKVFEQTYTRFLDLQKAEAQAREAQIEAAMERVRARAMAMQRPDELVDVAVLLRKEMALLGVEELETSSIYIHNETTGKTECWFAIQDREKQENLISDHMTIDLNDTWVGRQMLQFYRSADEKTSVVMQGANRTEWINYCAEQSDLFSVAGFYGKEIPDRTYHLYKFSNGYMGAASPGDISAESWNLLRRATTVFSLAYTRFSDLQTAEAQAREAQIELALERARTQSMLMQHSNELDGISRIFHEQLLLLGIDSEFSYVWLPNEEKGDHLFWATWAENKNGSTAFKSKAVTYPLDKTEPYTAACFAAWESDEPVHISHIPPAEVDNFFATWQELLRGAEHLRPALFPEGLYYAEAYIKYGCFGINIRRLLTEDEQQILRRFAIEFERAYTRFLDLKKAEEQAREAQIEAALERVRSQTMAMHNSREVGESVVTLFDELIKLGLDELTWCGIGIMHDHYRMEAWTASKTNKGQAELVIGHIDMKQHALLVGTYEGWQAKKESFQYILEGDDKIDYFNIINTQPDYVVRRDIPTLPPKVVLTAFYFHEGCLYAFSSKELSPETAKLFNRFTSVFAQTYRRYLDLLKAEEQARGAVKQASLDRVRGEIASMRTSEDLNRITPIIWRELEALEVPFIRCGVFIVDEEETKTQVYLTTPDGKSLAVLNLSFDANELTSNIVNHWRKERVYKEHWNKQEFIKWTKSMMELGQIQNAETYQGSSAPPDSLDLHFVPFTQGMLYVGNVSPLTDDKLELVKTLAEAFSIAYARYEDFQRLEAAKAEVEAALENLKKTQNQLVQAEKMASLGQLTAGIAHEIKNPLNFVNNFSELSLELTDELLEELEANSDKTIAESRELLNELLADLRANNEKINQHGKRADSIVKSMMQHARGGKGERQPTDLNALVEEYLNLAYHGMRARVPDFNVKMERDLGELDGKIDIVPQEIGRVLLNIFGNAFDAVRERAAAEANAYQPKLSVSTRYEAATAQIRIHDNGAGIPDEIQEKIFEPFFTTKPTGAGTGLGLSLSYDIVTQGHGGTLTLESARGQGTTFIIALPRDR